MSGFYGSLCASGQTCRRTELTTTDAAADTVTDNSALFLLRPIGAQRQLTLTLALNLTLTLTLILTLNPNFPHLCTNKSPALKTGTEKSTS